MSLSTRIYKKNISNKKINDSSSESNFTNHKENNSTKQLQSFQNLADQYVNYQSDRIFNSNQKRIKRDYLKILKVVSNNYLDIL